MSQNRDKKMQPKKETFWCSKCDAQLTHENYPCSNCGYENKKTENNRNKKIVPLIEDFDKDNNYDLVISQGATGIYQIWSKDIIVSKIELTDDSKG